MNPDAPTPETRDAANEEPEYVGLADVLDAVRAASVDAGNGMSWLVSPAHLMLALAKLPSRTPPAGPTVWVARELHELWQKNGWQPEPGTQLVADITLTVTPEGEQPRATVPYQLVPAAEASDA